MVLSKGHRSTSPVSSESTWLNASKLDAPFRLELLIERLGEAFDGPLAGAVDCECWDTGLTSNGSDLLDLAAGWRVLLSHDLQSFSCDIDQAKEVDLHLCSNLLVVETLELAAQAIACVVDDDVDTSELLQSFLERSIDGSVGQRVHENSKSVSLTLAW